MNELHLFAGIGGGILGGILLGHTTVCAVEIEPYARKVLLQRQRDGILPKFPIWDDVTTFDGKPWKGLVDVICGGFPCQDISCAGKGEGIVGQRSGLWGEMARIISEIRPKIVFVENSPMLAVRGLGKVLGDLSEMGYNAKWGVIGAESIGAPHKRERIWICATSNTDEIGWRASREGKIHYSVKVKQNKKGSKTTDRESVLRNIGEWYTPRILSGNIRGCNVFSERVDRLGAIGNAQVSGVAAIAFDILK